jgi:hypothetical protein
MLVVGKSDVPRDARRGIGRAWRRRLLGRAVEVLAVATLAAGCAATPENIKPSRGGPAEVQSPTASSAREISGSEFLLPSSLGAIATKVGPGPPPDAPGDPDKAVLALGLGTGAAAIPIGFVALAPGLIVGGPLLALAAAATYGTESGQANTVLRAVEASNFPVALEAALRSRASPSTVEGQPDIAATITVRGWGVVSSSGAARDKHCYVAAATLTVNRGAEQIYEEPLRLGTGTATEGAPFFPLQCATLGRFAEDGGRLVRETMRDYAEVMAVMIVDRLARLKR